jgi:EF hand
MMLKVTCFGSAALLAVIVGSSGLPAFAQGGGGGGFRAGLGDVDRDRQRVQDPMSGQDQMQDRDRDRAFDRDRLRDPDRDRLYLGTQDHIRAHDRDRDNRINRPEFEDWRTSLYGQLDADGNGFTLEEFHALRFGPGPYASNDPQQQSLMREQANLRKTERFRIMDGNGDGRITREEFMRFGEYAWLEADTDDDGRLTLQEMQRFNRGM